MQKLKSIDYGTIVYFTTMFMTIFFGTRFFGTNDDMLMMLFVSGIYTGEPSEFITFQNILVGQLLKQFYLFSPNINWYVGFLSMVQIISFTALYFLLKPLSSKTTNFFLFVLPLLYFIVELNLYIQFTKVAFIASIVGVLYALRYSKEPKTRDLFLSAGFITLGLLIREHSAYGSILLALPIIFVFAYKYKTNILNKNFFIFILTLLIITFSLKTYNASYYNNASEGWKNYKELIAKRGAIYYNRSITKECFEQASFSFGLTHNDILAFYKWTNDHNEVYTPEMLHHVSENCGKGFFSQNKKILKLNHFTNFFTKLSSFSSSYLLIFCLLLLFIYDKKHIKFLLLYFTYFILLLFFINTMVFDNRVVASLTLELYLLLLFTVLILKKPSFVSPKEAILFSISTFFLLIVYFNIYEKIVYKKEPFPIKEELLLLQGNYIITSKSGNFFNRLPLDTNFKNMFEETTFYYVGWNLGSPDSIKVLNGYKNFYELLLHKNNIILYTDKHRLPIIKTFFADHYQKHIDFIQFKQDYYKVIVNNLDKKM